jgi:hypothetical protein
MSEQRTPEDLVDRLRLAIVGAPTKHAKLFENAADCIEQLRMPPAKVIELSEGFDGADTTALIKALCRRIEGQRKHINALERKPEEKE